MKTYHRFMEIFWLVTFILTVIISIYINKKNSSPDYFVFLIPLVALAFFLIRRKIRKNEESKEKSN